MSLKKLMSYAQNLKIDRSDVVAQSVSRSGKVYTEKRSSVKPFRMTFTAPDYLPWTTENRLLVEDILSKDRHTPHTTQIEFSVSSPWMVAYLGSLTQNTSTGQIGACTFNSNNGNVLTINTPDGSVGDSILQVGDIIQPQDHPYPYVVVRSDAGITDYVKTGSTLAVTVHRPYIPHYVNGSEVSMTNKAVIAGQFCQYNMLVTQLPAINYVPGKFIQFSGDFTLLEQVEAY